MSDKKETSKIFSAKDSKEKKEKEKEEKIDLGLLEEDDEFEEFPAEEWQGKADDEELTIWEDNWDDDNIEDDFCKQLKSELEKQRMDSSEQMQ